MLGGGVGEIVEGGGRGGKEGRGRWYIRAFEREVWGRERALGRLTNLDSISRFFYSPIFETCCRFTLTPPRSPGSPSEISISSGEGSPKMNQRGIARNVALVALLG